jgi:Uma2 family endonuclease
MAIALGQVRRSKPVNNSLGKPAWDIALSYPMQGDWTEEDYLELESAFGNRMIELANGCLEVLPMPSLKHQRIVKWLLGKVDDFVVPRKLGETAMAPLPVRLFRGGIREPDIMYFEARRILDADRRPLDGADLVMEIPSPGRKNRERDLQVKREEYARAKIPEYWIVDPETKTITVLTLSGKSYKVHGAYKPGDQAASKLLKGFKVAVSDVFAAGEGK